MLHQRWPLFFQTLPHIDIIIMVPHKRIKIDMTFMDRGIRTPWIAINFALIGDPMRYLQFVIEHSLMRVICFQIRLYFIFLDLFHCLSLD